MNAMELAEHAGVTYRQLDHWTRLGYLHPSNPNCGTGRHREYPPSEVRLACRLGRLVYAGVSLAIAYEVAQGEPKAVESLRQALEEAS